MPRYFGTPLDLDVWRNSMFGATIVNMTLARIVSFLAGLTFLLYGLAFSALPVSMFSYVTGSDVSGPSALVDLRATYGGMTIAVGISILWLNHLRRYADCMAFVVLVLVAMAVTRTIGVFVEGGANALMYVYLGLELGGAAVACWAYRGVRNDV